MIHALPGMGADHRMYPSPWSTLPAFVADDWPRYSGEVTLEQIARAFCEKRHVEDGDIVIGSSLGGMIACEITRFRRIPELYLIGSAVHPGEVSGLLSALHPLAKVAPFDLLRFSASSIPTELSQMFVDIEPAFVRAMCAAIFDWKGLAASDTKIFRIHGSRDRVIPPPKIVDLLLDGGHLIAMSHAMDCVEFIRANKAPEPTTPSVTPAADAPVAPAGVAAHL